MKDAFMQTSKLFDTHLLLWSVRMVKSLMYGFRDGLNEPFAFVINMTELKNQF